MPVGRRVIELTEYQAFARKYAKGCGSEECPKATNICLARGDVPCDVLFVGMAPGDSEDSTGSPFVGPAGHLMDDIINAVLKDTGVKWCLTNLVCCMPHDAEGRKEHDPTEEQMDACKGRLEEFIRICRPKLLICVGSLSEKRFPRAGTAEYRKKTGRFKHEVQLPEGVILDHIVHPSYILQKAWAHRPLLTQRCAVTIAGAARAAGLLPQHGAATGSPPASALPRKD